MWILILTTWMELVSTDTLQLEVENEYECRRLEARIEKMFEGGPIGYMIECDQQMNGPISSMTLDISLTGCHSLSHL